MLNASVFFFFLFHYFRQKCEAADIKERNTQKKKLVLSENNNIFTIWLRLRNSCVDISVLFGF